MPNLNPLLADPTNLALQRRTWAKAVKARNDQLRDAFLIFLLTQPTPENLEQYLLQFQRAWEEYARQLAEASAAYVQQAYKAGAIRSFREVRPTAPPQQGKPQPADEKALFFIMLLGMPSTSRFLRLLAARAAQSLKALGPTSASKAAEIISRALLEGWTPKQLRNALVAEIKVTAKRAALIAETELTRAHAEGQLDAMEALGVKKVGAVVEFVTVAGRGASQEEMKEQRVCPKCRGLAGKVFTIKQARGVIPVHPRCLLPNTQVLARDVVSAVRTIYRGYIIEIATASGRHLTITENHKLLTPEGFAPAKSLRNRGYILGGTSLEFADNPNNNDRPTPVSEIFDTLAVSPSVASVSVPHSSEYLHGDARFCDGYIDVVRPTRFLGGAFEPQTCEHFDDFPLSAIWGRSLFNGFSLESLALCGLGLAANGVVGRCREFLSLLGRGQFHPHVHPLAAVAGFESSPFHSHLNCRTADTQAIRSLLDGFPRFVSPDQIVHVNRKFYEGHVYDLQTVSGIYNGNGVWSSNCRCRWFAVRKATPKLQLALA